MAGIAHTAVPSVNPPKAASRLSHPKPGWWVQPTHLQHTPPKFNMEPEKKSPEK